MRQFPKIQFEFALMSVVVASTLMQPAFAAPSGAIALPLRAERRLSSADHLSRLLKIKPSWNLYLERAEYYYAQGRQSAALGDCEKSLAVLPTPPACYLAVFSALGAGKSGTAKAVRYSQVLTKTAPLVTQSYELACFTAFLAGDYDKALTNLVEFQRVALFAARDIYRLPDPGFVSNLTDAKLNAMLRTTGGGKGEAVRARIASALSAFFRHKYAPCAKSCAALLDGTSKLEGRQKDFVSALQICSYSFMRDYKQAFEQSRKLTTSAGAFREAMLLFDAIGFAAAKREEVLAVVDKLIDKKALAAGRHSAGMTSAIELRAEIVLELSQPQEVARTVELLKRSCSIARGGVSARSLLLLARLQALCGNERQAIVTLNDYIKGNPQDGEAHFLRAQLNSTNRHTAEAVADLTAALKCGYNTVKALRARSVCYRALGKLAEMRQDEQSLSLIERFIQQIVL